MTHTQRRAQRSFLRVLADSQAFYAVTFAQRARLHHVKTAYHRRRRNR